MTTHHLCPRCQSPLCVIEAQTLRTSITDLCGVSVVEERMADVVCLSCSSCEFMLELTPMEQIALAADLKDRNIHALVNSIRRPKPWK